MKNKDITFLAMTVKYGDDELHDVTVDLETRDWVIEKVDNENTVLEPQESGKLRKRSIQKYLDILEDLDLVNWPLLEESPTKTFSTIIDNTVVLYIFDENGSEYFTTGRTDDDLKALHKATEHLIGQTFGSYNYYK